MGPQRITPINSDRLLIQNNVRAQDEINTPINSDRLLTQNSFDIEEEISSPIDDEEYEIVDAISFTDATIPANPAKNEAEIEVVEVNFSEDIPANYYANQISHWRVRIIAQAASPYVREISLVAAAGIPPLALAFNAFCAFPHIKVVELSLDKVKTFSTSLLAISSLNAASSFAVNALLNYGTIPHAFSMLHDRMWVNFKKHPYKNTGIIFLALGAGISTATIGYHSFLPLGQPLAWTNFATNGFIFFVTRFYGLVNALHRFEKWCSHRYSANPFTSKTFDDLLSHVNDHVAMQLEAMLRGKTDLTEKDILSLLKKLDLLQKENSGAIEGRSKAEILGILFDITLATTSGIAVFSIFGQKFLDGLDQLINLIRGSNEPLINDLSTGVKALLSTLSIATPILYSGQTLLLRTTFANTYSSIMDPANTLRMKIGKGSAAIGLCISNVLACTSIYNLTESTIKDPNYYAQDLTPPDSVASTTHKILGAIGAFNVNAKLSFEKALPPPANTTTPILERVGSSANLPELVRQHSGPGSLEVIREDDDDDDFEYLPTPIEVEQILSELKTPLSENKTPLTINDGYFNYQDPAKQPRPQLQRAITWLRSNTLSQQSIEELRKHHQTLFQKPEGANPLVEPLLADETTLTI